MNNQINKKDNKNIKIVENIDLFRNQYNEEVLIYNINNLTTYDIVRTQHKLSKEFINQYILNSEYND